MEDNKLTTAQICELFAMVENEHACHMYMYI